MGWKSSVAGCRGGFGGADMRWKTGVAAHNPNEGEGKGEDHGEFRPTLPCNNEVATAFEPQLHIALAIRNKWAGYKLS